MSRMGRIDPTAALAAAANPPASYVMSTPAHAGLYTPNGPCSR